MKRETLIAAIEAAAEPVRLEILRIIAAHGELRAKDILPAFDITQPTLSHHMSCLTEAGLVNVERRGRFAYYSVNKDTIDLVLSGIESLKSGSKKTEKAKGSSDDTDKELKKSKKKKKKDKGKKKKKD